jgi:hypothetical protein
MPNPDPYVHHTNEASLLWIWENCYNKWWYVLSKGIQSEKPEFKRKVKAIKAKEESTRTDEEKELLAAIFTPYTNAASGQKKFGGWREEGWTAYKKHKKMLKKNREEHADVLKEVEDRVFTMVRKKNKRDELDANAALRGHPVQRQDQENEESEVDSDDDQF